MQLAPSHPAAHWTRPVRAAARGLLDAWLPQSCVGCAAWIACEDGGLCSACTAAFEQALAAHFCPRCLRSASPASIHDGACAICRKEAHWTIAGATRIGAYSVDPLREALLAVKFGGSERAADVLGHWLARRLAREPWLDRIDAFVPVPMHPLRRLQRPAAHAALLAGSLARAVRVRTGLRIPVWARAARRIRYAPSQMCLAVRRQRFANVRGCFRADSARLRGARVCVVDNLLVTGATMHELVKALRSGGAKALYVAVAARTVAAGDVQGQPALHGPAAGPPAAWSGRLQPTS